MIPGLAWERLEKRSSEVSRGPSETYPPMLSRGFCKGIRWGLVGWGLDKKREGKVLMKPSESLIAQAEAVL